MNFAIFSAHAERVVLCLYDESGQFETARYELGEYTDQVWHGFLPGLSEGAVYGYRVDGPFSPDDGHRFDPSKLLVDPYAREVRGEFQWNPALYHSDTATDSAPFVPKSVVVSDSFDWRDDPSPAIPWSDTVIYEGHVRGLTMQHPAVPEADRGTFAGIAHPAIINHLKSLGVTTLELLPVQFYLDESALVERGLRNFWGYNTLAYFTPEPRYSHSNGADEFRRMVKALHQAGLELLLDVAFNHTAESDHLGPTLCYRGIDNASYYHLQQDRASHYVNDTGCGNTLNVNHPRVMQLVLDCLRYWVQSMHVDGFRFDLATTLGRDGNGFAQDAAFFKSVLQDPVLREVKLIAEPWDTGPGGYQLGNFPPGWSEWNDRYRDTVRRFWRGDHGVAPEFARRIHGSSDLFEHRGRRPWASTNFVTCHDGFTLTDLVSYARKHNEANGEDNRDGHSENYSANYGIEGPSQDETIGQLRDRQKKNLLATLLLSQGVPMLRFGDEMGHSQLGNNNAYCQDNEIGWCGWDNDVNGEFIAFIAKLNAIRRREPLLRPRRFIHGEDHSPIDQRPNIQWLHTNARVMTEDEWHEADRLTFALMLNATEPLAEESGPQSASLLMLFNAAVDPVAYCLPDRGSTGSWRSLIDTAAVLGEGDVLVDQAEVTVEAQSLVVLSFQTHTLTLP